MTYSRPLNVKVAFQNRETGEIREQSVFMGDFPWMTDRGTFVINGTERVVVTQLVRSPGAYLMEPKDREKQVFIANLMPARGSWLELEIDKKGKVFVRIDRKRKLPVTVLLRAMGYSSDEEILRLFDNSLYIRNTIESDTEATRTEEGALIELFKKQRPGEPPSVDNAKALLNQLFFDPKRYDLTRVGRYKLNSRLALDEDLDTRTLTHRDIIELIRELISLPKALGIPESGEFDSGEPIKDYALEAQILPREPVAERLDEYEHFGNRRLRTVGELIQEAAEHGFVTTPYRVVQDGVVTNKIVHLDANEEEHKVIAQANAEMDAKTGKLRGPGVTCRSRDGELVLASPKDVDLMDVSPDQIWSVATALIPFLEHDDANRALMGSNMQRQAVPLLKTEAPLIGTGMETRAAIDTGDVLLAENAGTVSLEPQELLDAIRERVPPTRAGRRQHQVA